MIPINMSVIKISYYSVEYFSEYQIGDNSTGLSSRLSLGEKGENKKIIIAKYFRIAQPRK